MGVAQRAVHFRASIREPIDEMLARDTHDGLAPRLFHVDRRTDNRFVCVVCGIQRGSRWIADATASNERESSLVSDTVHGGKIDSIFNRPRVGHKLRNVLGTRRPVRGEEHKICSQQGQHANGFRKPAVVANQHSDPDASSFEYRERTIAICGEPINAEIRKMDFPVTSNQSIGADQCGRVKQAVTVPFQHAKHGVAVVFCAQFGRKRGGCSINRFAIRQTLLERIEAIARDEAFRKHDQSATGLRFLFDTAGHGLQIGLHVPKYDICLNS